MNWQLFSAFLVITLILFLAPGPIVTQVVTTGGRSGSRAALLTVAGASTGNALLVVCIAFGLSWVLKLSTLDRRRLSDLARRSGVAARRRYGRDGAAARPRLCLARFRRGDHQSEIDRVLHSVPAAIH
jgi:hypothetical protein